MTPREAALRDNPGFAFLDPNNVPGVETLMRQLGYLDGDESVTRVARAGEGNMNLTLRVTTTRRSVVLKQSRPWVEKYDFISAPWDRAVVERRFYLRVRGVPGLADRMPALLGYDDRTRTLLLEDLGDARDFSAVYATGNIDEALLSDAGRFLRRLHDHTAGERGDDFANREMRTLNHAHIYDIPLTDHNLVDLETFEPGLADAAAQLRADDAFVAAARATGGVYLAEPDDDAVLLHGDFFPGSLLDAGGKGLKVIDPEFCFAGDRAFDVGVMLGHLTLADVKPDAFLNAYGRDACDASLAARVAGCEVVRRIIGVAQLPLPKTSGRRATLIRRGRDAVLEQDIAPLFS